MCKNEYNKLKYVLNAIFSAVVTTVVFRSSLFLCIDGFTYKNSKIFLWCCVGIILSIGTAFTIRCSRNDLSIFSSIGLALGLYSIITFLKYYITLCVVVGTIFFIILSVRLYNIITKKYKNRTKHQISKKYMAILSIFRTIGIYLITVLILISGSKLLDIGLLSSSVEKHTKSTENSYSYSSEELLQSIDDWDYLSNHERIDFLQCIANIEVEQLDLDHELNVILTVLDQNTYSSYCEATHTIAVNIKILELESVEEMINSIAHEAAHAWQNQLIKDCESGKETRAEYIDKANTYKNEFSKYKRNIAVKDYDKYYNLECEIDARTYASNELYYLCNLLSTEVN